MSRSTILVVCLSIAVGYILANGFNRSSAGQPPEPVAGALEGRVCRYQFSHSADGRYPAMFLTDTVTGRVWSRGFNTDSQWHAFGSPAEGKQDPVRR
jgi:hypothetical protein